ncbi:hypothetical protein KIN20_010685 [Parelaphostrongylus tenuis]|uniref:Uncharacterized protein n=1 Tax=Parelaphostrongylus tenuis TaxID=148309 RepID=A0AAD5MZA8_PARTN|nr:hypothetical protein KIN20_010685 [Parelaphostrongylus tenuis]
MSECTCYDYTSDVGNGATGSQACCTLVADRGGVSTFPDAFVDRCWSAVALLDVSLLESTGVEVEVSLQVEEDEAEEAELIAVAPDYRRDVRVDPTADHHVDTVAVRDRHDEVENAYARPGDADRTADDRDVIE